MRGLAGNAGNVFAFMLSCEQIRLVERRELAGGQGRRFPARGALRAIGMVSLADDGSIIVSNCEPRFECVEDGCRV